MDNTFQTLARAIVYQQLSGKAAATIHGRAVDAFGTRKKISPEPTTFGQGRSAAGRGAIEKQGRGSEGPGDQDARWRGAHRGQAAQDERRGNRRATDQRAAGSACGPWKCCSCFGWVGPTYCRSRIWACKGFMLTYGHKELPKPTAILAHGERWRPYRSVASWYLWHRVRLGRQGACADVGRAPAMRIIPVLDIMGGVVTGDGMAGRRASLPADSKLVSSWLPSRPPWPSAIVDRFGLRSSSISPTSMRSPAVNRLGDVSSKSPRPAHRLWIDAGVGDIQIATKR